MVKSINERKLVPWRLCSSHLDCLVRMWLAHHQEYALLAALCNISYHLRVVFFFLSFPFLALLPLSLLCFCFAKGYKVLLALTQSCFMKSIQIAMYKYMEEGILKERDVFIRMVSWKMKRRISKVVAGMNVVA